MNNYPPYSRADKYAHRSISGAESAAKPQSIEAVRDALRNGLNIEVDVSANGHIGHVRDMESFTGDYDQSQGAWEDRAPEDIDHPRFGDVLWLAQRHGSTVLAEIKASSPAKAVEAAHVAFDEVERTHSLLASHNLDHASISERGDAVSFMSFSVEALDTVAEREATTATTALQAVPKILLGTSKPENAHDMAMSATVLEALAQEGIDYTAIPWSQALIELASRKNYDTIAPHWSVVDEKFVRQATEHGLAVGAWTVPNEKIDTLEAMGVQTIVTEQAVPHEHQQVAEKATQRRAKKLARRAIHTPETNR